MYVAAAFAFSEHVDGVEDNLVLVAETSCHAVRKPQDVVVVVVHIPPHSRLGCFAVVLLVVADACLFVRQEVLALLLVFAFILSQIVLNEEENRAANRRTHICRRGKGKCVIGVRRQREKDIDPAKAVSCGIIP